MQHEVDKDPVLVSVLLQLLLQLRDGEAVEVEVVVLVVERFVVEGGHSCGVVSDQGVIVLVKRLQGQAELLHIAVGRVVREAAVLLQSLCRKKRGKRRDRFNEKK